MNASIPTRGPRISLRTLLVLVTCFAMGVAIWQLNTELGPLRTEVRKLRDETGQLTIEDPEKVHAIEIATDYPLAWKWRVYVPAGKQLRLAQHNHQIPKEELPNVANGPLLVGPKEFVVAVKVDNQPDGQWRSGVSCDGGTTYQLFPKDSTRWLNKGSSGSQFAQVRRNVSVAQDGEPLVLLRKRMFYTRGQIPPTDEPAETDGLLVWLVECE